MAWQKQYLTYLKIIYSRRWTVFELAFTVALSLKVVVGDANIKHVIKRSTKIAFLNCEAYQSKGLKLNRVAHIKNRTRQIARN